jgi:KipI family sensor histidine kinase inhibitor
VFGVKTAVDDCGDAAVRVCVRGGTVEQNWDTVRSIAARLDPSSDGIVSVIPTYDALLVEFDNLHTDHDAVRALVSDAAAAPEPLWGAPRTFEIPVVYGGEYGPDLRETAEFLGVSDTEVIRLHSAAPLVMRCYGSPGGAPMLDGPAFGLPIPRRSSPRPRVAAGSVAVAGRQAVVSAKPAPGGWAVIGRTPLTLVDPAAEQISVYRPGDLFVFRAIDADRWDEFDGRSLLPIGGDSHG